MSLTKHFEMEKPKNIERRVFIPGFSQPIIKKLFSPPLRIVQTGFATNDEIAGLETGLRDPTVTSTLDAQNIGSFTNMFKAEFRTTGAPTSGSTVGTVLSYSLSWEQVCVS